MKRFLSRIVALFTERITWVRQIVVASLAAGSAWFIGEQAFVGGGLVAAIVCSLSIRISLYKSVREGLGQILGTAIGGGVALLTVYYFDFGFIAVVSTVLLCSVVARGLHLGEVASVNVPVTALIVIGPGINTSTAETRLFSTFIGAAVAIAFSYFSHASTPAGRTIDQISRLGKKSAELLGTMAEGVASGYSQEVAGKWLMRARILIEDIPTVRSQALEAKKYARWSPLAEADEADALYLRGIAMEHTVVQVRTIARTLFDSAVAGGVTKYANRQIGNALSATSYAISAKVEAIETQSAGQRALNIAEDLRLAAAILAEELIAENDRIDQEEFVRNISLVSNMERIADSLDESSPALSDVNTPDEPDQVKVMSVSPVTLATKWPKRLWFAIRKFLQR
ncbi:MAG: FUSC family protein [Candidatus Planktophila sp.]